MRKKVPIPYWRLFTLSLIALGFLVSQTSFAQLNTRLNKKEAVNTSKVNKPTISLEEAKKQVTHNDDKQLIFRGWFEIIKKFRL